LARKERSDSVKRCFSWQAQHDPPHEATICKLNRLRATVFVIQLSRRLFQIVKPIVFVFSTFTAGKFGKMVYHNDWKELHQEVSDLHYRHTGIRESDFARLLTSPDCQGRSLGLQNSAWLVKFCLAGLGKTITLGSYRTRHIYT
jgi:hypothetical protein